MYINSALLKIKNIDAKIQGLLLKSHESIGIVGATNIQHRWKIKMLQLHTDTQLMLINSILTYDGHIEPTVWAGLPLTENQLIAFITCKECEVSDLDNDSHKNVTAMYRYLDDIVTHYNASITPAMKEHILKLFPTPLDTHVPTGNELTTSTVTGAGLYMHELELLLKLFSSQELLQRFPDPKSNIWNTNQDLCDIIYKRKYTVIVQRCGTEYKIESTQLRYCDIVTEDCKHVNITNLQIGSVIRSKTIAPKEMEDFVSNSYYDDDKPDTLIKTHKHIFKVLDVTYK